eukprot:scaffold1518_cov158-Skeletonema_marinoi.AAC.1
MGEISTNNSNNDDKLDPGGLHNWAQQLSTLLENDDNNQKSIDYLDVRGCHVTPSYQYLWTHIQYNSYLSCFS